MRLDAFLLEKGLAVSRAKAKEMIQLGAVLVNGISVTKPAYDVGDDEVRVKENPLQRYVSRGGLKLEAALEAFSVSPLGLVCLDVGASSGGFTDCLLQHGAAKVYAVDSGVGQLHERLRDDTRVIVYEKCNARQMTKALFSDALSLAVMDVSFISQTVLYPALSAVLTVGGRFVSLFKPQFEVGRGHVGKGGIVRNEKAVAHALQDALHAASLAGFRFEGKIPSPILGGDGNREYLLLFTKTDKGGEHN